MARKKHSQHENHERWMVSYADFVTLLFAFFVVMFATSKADNAKAAQVSESVKKALQEGQISTVIAGLLAGSSNTRTKGPGGAQTERPIPEDEPNETVWADLVPSVQYLTKELEEEIKLGKVVISMEHRGLVVSLPEAAFFPSGQAAIQTEAFPALKKIGTVIDKLPNPVRLEGHTDSVPIRNEHYRSNWDLSAARGIAVLEFLKTQCGVAEARLAVAGYADTVPVQPNDSEMGRARNRRVDITILNRSGFQVEPGAQSETRQFSSPAGNEGGHH